MFMGFFFCWVGGLLFVCLVFFCDCELDVDCGEDGEDVGL